MIANKPKILVTLGPSSLKESIISEMDKESIHLYRINLSHTHIDELETIITKIQEISDTPICLDSEGAQIRNNYMKI